MSGRALGRAAAGRRAVASPFWPRHMRAEPLIPRGPCFFFFFFPLFQRQKIAARAAEEAERENADRDRYVHETQDRLNEISFSFSWGD